MVVEEENFGRWPGVSPDWRGELELGAKRVLRAERVFGRGAWVGRGARVARRACVWARSASGRGAGVFA